jgi:hypothetical protein
MEPWQACPMQKCSSFFFFFLLSKHDAHGPVSCTCTRDPCLKPKGLMRPKGGRAAAAEPTEKERSEPVSPFLNLRYAAVLDPCRRPNGSVRPKGDRSAAAVSRQAVRVPCRMPNGSVRPKGGRAVLIERDANSQRCATLPMPYAEWLNETKGRQWGGSRGNRPRCARRPKVHWSGGRTGEGSDMAPESARTAQN